MRAASVSSQYLPISSSLCHPQEEELRRKIAENAQLHQTVKEYATKHQKDVANLRRQLKESDASNRGLSKSTGVQCSAVPTVHQPTCSLCAAHS